MHKQCPGDHHHLSAVSANARMFADGNGAKNKRRDKSWLLWGTNAPSRKELGCREIKIISRMVPMIRLSCSK
jgi:hypothetical protein